jgi:invasion protein IalB
MTSEGRSIAQIVRRLSAVALALAVIGSAAVRVGAQVSQPAQGTPPPASVAPHPQPQLLPGGASQLQETHGDWRVVCGQAATGRVCALAQQQTKQDSRQLVLGIELNTTAADNGAGTLLLPFGIAVEKPVALQIDDAGQPLSLHVRTCVPVGCVVPLTLDSALVRALKNGKVWNVKVVADGGQELPLQISLNGFASAFDRTATLSKQ